MHSYYSLNLLYYSKLLDFQQLSATTQRVNIFVIFLKRLFMLCLIFNISIYLFITVNNTAITF